MQQKISFLARGKKTDAILDLPGRKENEKAPALVLVHGLLGRKEQRLLSTIASHFCDAGFVVLRFDFYGASANAPSKEIPLVSTNVEQLEEAIAFVRKQPQVDSKRVFLGGHSYGANICILVGAKEKITGALLFAPGREFQKYAHLASEGKFKIFGHAFTVDEKAWKEWLDNSLPEALAKNKEPITVFAATNDEFVPLDSLKQRFAGKKIILFEGANHFFKGEEEKVARIAVKLFS